MRKLIGQRSPVVAGSPKAQAGAEPMSLAAFMGSRATGPRLNKHPVQQDTHDPTQFDQPARMAAPHPVFGKGGIAMPGMSPAVKPSISTLPVINVKEVAPSPTPIRERKMSTSSVARKYAERMEQDTLAAQRPGASYKDNTRERTMSTPAGLPAFKNTPPPVQPKPDLHRAPIAQSSLPEVRPSPAAFRSTLSPAPPSDFPRSPSRTPDVPVHNSPVIAAPSSPIPRRQSASPNRPPSAPRKSSVSSPVALARPVQTNSKPAFMGPQIISYNASPAFLKSPPSKDVTPSISRLQGRGFVQNMIKVSSNLESDSSGNANSPLSTPEKLDTKKSVLDRWPASPNSTPNVSPKPIPMRKARTFEPSNPSPPAVKQGFPSSIPKRRSQTFTPSTPKATLPSPSPAMSAKSAPATVSSPEKVQSSVVVAAPKHGVGSSNTLVSYIKPVKTGDSPPTETSTPISRPKTPVKSVKFADPPAPVARAKTPVRDVDELGVRKKPSVGKLKQDVGKSVILPSPRSIIKESSSPVGGQPLSHVRHFW